MSESQFTETPWLDPEAKPIVQISDLTKRYGDVAAVDNGQPRNIQW